MVIPPSPELLGALGVALLALERSHASMGIATDLLTLAAPEMKRTSRFTCGACTMYCSIDHFEVAGRRFPFGGRCSLYENVWKRKARIAAAPDLVEQRSKLLFERTAGKSTGNGKQIGIPKALTTHSLYPLYSTFFAGLGMEVVLSEVDPRGELKSNAGFCFPAQIAHGAVFDLVQRGVELIFLPHVMRMPQREAWKESYLCPITQASPYFLAKAYPQIHLLSPLLDFSDGYAACSALVEIAVNELGQTRESAERQWSAAVRAQTDAERELEQLGKSCTGTCDSGQQTGHRPGRPQLQCFHTGRFAIGGQETIEYGSGGDSRRLPDAGGCRPDLVALRQPGDERRENRQTAAQSVSSVREQLQLHYRRFHPIDARFRDGLKTLSDSRDRRPYRRRRRANPLGSISRYRQKLS